MVVGHGEADGVDTDRLDTDRFDRLFQALADPTRRDIVRLVLQTEQSVSALAAHYPMSFAAVQKHVAVLERAQLVHKRRRGREQLVRGDIDALRAVHRLFDRYEAVWRSRVDRMGELLAEPGPAAPATDDHQPTQPLTRVARRRTDQE
jgi:DNA-binding transcriptional ArsR family regulator